MVIVDFTGIDVTAKVVKQHGDGEVCVEDLVKLLSTEGLVRTQEPRKIRGKDKTVIWLNNVKHW